MSRPFCLCTVALYALLLSSCGTTSRQLPTVAPGQLFKGSYLEIKAPTSEGWRLVDSSVKGMAFAKPGQAPGETFGAMIVMFDLQPAGSPDQFVTLIKEAIQKDTDQKRFDITETSVDYTNERGYQCVRYHAVFNDKEAQTSRTTKERLLLEAQSLYCRHPVRTDTGFAAIYSYRGRSRYSGLAVEAQDFIQGVQVPSTKP